MQQLSGVSPMTTVPKYPWALRNLPPFPPVANRLLALLQNQNVSNIQLAEVIRMDATFSFELLRLANSSLFGFAHQIIDIGHAISVVGLERVKAMVMMVALNAQIKSALRYQRLLDCWVHCLACAVLSEQVAYGCGLPPERAYTAGLLHDVGRLGMMTAYPQEYNRLLDVAADENLQLIDAELDVFDIDHCMAGAWLVAEWNLPNEVGIVAQTHHEPPIAGDREMGNVIRITNRLTNALGFHVLPPKEDFSYPALRRMLPSIAQRNLPEDPEELRLGIQERVLSFTAPKTAA
ncbi:MAG: HDOD domain-containing protein [Bryobacterales bacterium]|nr:HDOD domain-containing protein [Bryobacterales bacterium]